jgi:ABC-type transporter Mla subunit MlaD
MNVVRNEIRTGLLVLFTLSILIAVIIYIGSPGVFRKMKYYDIYFQNAGGVQIGAPVLLGGRRVGQVFKLISPVPESERPRGDLEVIVRVEVDATAQIYKEVDVSMLQYGLLGEEVIDFRGGSQASGLADSQTIFIGDRQPGLNDAVPEVLKKIDPVVKGATDTMKELQKTASRLTELTSQGSDLTLAIANFRQLTQNFVDLSGTEGSVHKTLSNLEQLTDEDSPLSRALKNAEDFTGRLSNNKDIDVSLRNFRSASANLNTTSNNLNKTVKSLGPELRGTVHNAEQFTDTVKHQPWRLIWPTTKKYPDDKRPEAVAERTRQKPVVKRRLWADDPPKRGRR